MQKQAIFVKSSNKLKSGQITIYYGKKECSPEKSCLRKIVLAAITVISLSFCSVAHALTWSPPQVIAHGHNGATSIAVDQNGDWHVVYNIYSYIDDILTSSINYLSSEGLIGQVTYESGFIDDVSIDVDSNGGLHISYVHEPEDNPNENYVMYTTTEYQPDFSIESIKPVQVVWNSDINGDDVNDLVAGKDTAVLAYVGMTDYEGLDEQELINIRLSFDGRNYPPISRTIEELETDNRIEFYPDAPAILGDQEIIVKVEPDNPQIEDANEANNTDSVKITVKETNSLHLVYFPVNGVDPDGPLGPLPGVPGLGYGPINLTEYSNTATNCGTFIEAVYPVAGSKFTNDPRNNKYYGSPVPIWDLGVLEDLLRIWLWMELLTLTSADKAVGIVPDDYFAYHGLDAAGLATTIGHSALVEVGHWTTGAHEIGHCYPYRLDDQYNETADYTGEPTNGYWVSERRKISNGSCFMGKAPYKSYYYPDGTPVWICDEDYIDLFQKFRVNTTDPPTVLLLNGIISKDGTIQLGSWYMVENGITDHIMPGDYSIQILDVYGQTLTNTPFHTSFELHIDPVGIVETDFAGFAFVITYPENASRINIQYNGQTLIEINPNSKLLHDAVDSIPDYGFIKNPDQNRKALHNKIDEIEIKIESNEIQDAANKLEFDVKDKLEKWLVDGYQPQNPLQLSKDELIELVDNIVERLNIIQPRSSKDGELTDSDIGDADPEIHSLDSELLAFWDDLEGNDHFGPYSPSKDVDDDSTIPEDGEEDIEEDPPTKDNDEENPPTTDNGEADTGDDEAIAVEEAAVFTLFEATEAINELDPENFNNEDVAIALTNEIGVVLSMMDEELYTEAVDKLQNDILERTNGCADIGKPDDNDWIRTYEGQGLVYPLVLEAIELLESLI